MPNTTLFTLVRHGETDWNRAGIIQGSTDIPLNELGRDQARRAAGVLGFHDCTSIVSSTMDRAKETAAIIAGELSLPLGAAVAELCEQTFGEAEGSDWASFAERFPDGPAGQESAHEVRGRALDSLRAIADTHAEETTANVVVVTHGGVIKALTGHPDLAGHDFGGPAANGSITRLALHDGRLCGGHQLSGATACDAMAATA
ncbi:histidine phosphatase family protein [Arthrobacter sp. ERGS1:01]|uniref:histidine phosphatase family protein n=1 Tax=Arthrobacter sp. ERGS1:01 TaxID=1704044 RepID=UPI0006B618AD|nr:histidine phosphatase family protein [Arthrobacter sp. ERGS1:01]